MTYDDAFIYQHQVQCHTTFFARRQRSDRFVFEIDHFIKYKRASVYGIVPKHRSHKKHVNNFVNSKFRQISCRFSLESAALYLIFIRSHR